MTPNALDALRALAKDIEDAKIPGVRSELKIAQRLRAILRAEEERAADRTFTIYEAGSHHAIATVPNPFDPAIDRETISGGPTEAGAKAEVDAVVHEAADKALVAALTYKEAKAPWDRICPVCGHGFAVDVNAKAEAGVTPFDDHEVVADDLHKLGWTSMYDDAQWEHLREWCKAMREQWLARPVPVEAQAEAGEPNIWDRGKRPWTLSQWLQWANDNGATLTMNQILDDWQASTRPAPDGALWKALDNLIESAGLVYREEDSPQNVYFGESIANAKKARHLTTPAAPTEGVRE